MLDYVVNTICNRFVKPVWFKRQMKHYIYTNKMIIEFDMLETKHYMEIRYIVLLKESHTNCSLI